MLRKNEGYLEPATEAERNTLMEHDLYDEEMVNHVFTTFFGQYLKLIFHFFSPPVLSSSFNLWYFSYVSDDACDYLDSWTEQFEPIKCFAWIALRSAPDWVNIRSAMKQISERTSLDTDSISSKIFDQYGCVKNYCSKEKIIEWGSKNVPTEDRWVDIFKYLDSQQIPYIEFSYIVEYILCLPGSSAPVERIFSQANKIWKQESSALLVPTLHSILVVKNNMEYSCIDFYKFLKTQPVLLRQIASQDKYDFKQDHGMASASTSAMSIDLESEGGHENEPVESDV